MSPAHPPNASSLPPSAPADYSGLSASMPTMEDNRYFALMMRNTWHIPSGGAQAANTVNNANSRVQVTHLDGTQTIESIDDNLGLDLTDQAAVLSKLKKQGIWDVVYAVELSVEMSGSAGSAQTLSAAGLAPKPAGRRENPSGEFRPCSPPRATTMAAIHNSREIYSVMGVSDGADASPLSYRIDGVRRPVSASPTPYGGFSAPFGNDLQPAGLPPPSLPSYGASRAPFGNTVQPARPYPVSPRINDNHNSSEIYSVVGGNSARAGASPPGYPPPTAPRVALLTPPDGHGLHTMRKRSPSRQRSSASMAQVMGTTRSDVYGTPPPTPAAPSQQPYTPPPPPPEFSGLVSGNYINFATATPLPPPPAAQTAYYSAPRQTPEPREPSARGADLTALVSRLQINPAQSYQGDYVKLEGILKKLV